MAELYAKNAGQWVKVGGGGGDEYEKFVCNNQSEAKQAVSTLGILDEVAVIVDLKDSKGRSYGKSGHKSYINSTKDGEDILHSKDFDIWVMYNPPVFSTSGSSSPTVVYPFTLYVKRFKR